jgi:hypothetical protein
MGASSFMADKFLIDRLESSLHRLRNLKRGAELLGMTGLASILTIVERELTEVLQEVRRND